MLAVMLAGCGGGAGPAPPRVRTVSADTLYAWLSGGYTVALFDARPDSLFNRGHVPGSVHVHGKSIPELRDVLPFGPDVPIVVVETDTTAHALSSRLAAYGFARVLRLGGGVAAWRESGHTLDGYRTFPR